MRFLRYFGWFLLFMFLTIITQIGGLVFLLCFPLFKIINENIGRNIYRFALNFLIFSLIYGIISYWIVPPLATSNGRVPMPFGTDNPNLKPLNFLTVVFNRHYATPTLRQITEGVSKKMADKNPTDSLVVKYLECGFPFFDGFPLYPHLSHNDGKKIDLSLFYVDSETKMLTNERPAWWGYGVSEEPRAGEENWAQECRERGNWQYSFMRNYIVSQNRKSNFIFDARRTRDFMSQFLADNRVNFILIEPHLKTRLGFQNMQKIKIPPCEAVRHDDHIHVAVY